MARSQTPSERNADILCFSHLRWHFVTQRPQHLLTRAARDRRVFYWEEPVWHHDDSPLPAREDGSLGMHLEVLQESPTLWVLRPHLSWGIDCAAGQRTLLDEFRRAYSVDAPTLWYYTPMALEFSGHLIADVTVYDCMDELSCFLNAPAGLVARERELFEKADVVFTGGVSLYEKKRLEHANVHASPSSIDVAHFSQAQAGHSLADPFDQAQVAHPRAGFYGVVDERFDCGLLAEVARLRPNVNFILLGPVVKIDPAGLPRAANIHYIDGRSYAELPSYIAGWDVALLPFALNDATRFISPTKTPEYLAAGKPVVSTPIRDVVRGYGDEGLVEIASTAEEFAIAIDRALQPPRDGWQEAVKEKLARNSWDSTWEAMQLEISRSGWRTCAADIPTLPAWDDLTAHKVQYPSSTRGVAQSVSRRTPAKPFDTIVVGAGFAGSVVAERLATQAGERVLLIDKRDHIGGNAYDFHNEQGILVHKYGPHIFHTNSDKVLAYLSSFTKWRQYEHRVLSSVDGKLLPVPINLDTINKLYDLTLTSAEMKEFIAARAIPCEDIRTSEAIVLSRVGHDLYEKFFQNYTRKQWGVDPSQLDASVAGRIPVRFDRDDRYFTDTHQVMPLHGYTRMFESMLDHPYITTQLGVDYRDLRHSHSNSKIIFTGPIDEYYGFCFGPLPYRSLEFRHETHHQDVFQAAPVINYPNEHAYTRVTEFKYLTGQKHAGTSIVYEYPKAAGDPYYPIPRPENTAIYERYQQLAQRDSRVHFCGRLATYRYLNMDQVVGQALALFQKLSEGKLVKNTMRVAAPPTKLHDVATVSG